VGAAAATCGNAFPSVPVRRPVHSIGPPATKGIGRSWNGRGDGYVLHAGLPMRDLNPSLYRQPPSAPMRTRDSVRAELDAARRSGDLLADGDSGL